MIRRIRNGQRWMIDAVVVADEGVGNAAQLEQAIPHAAELGRLHPLRGGTLTLSVSQRAFG
jgi:hypothetical protein